MVRAHVGPLENQTVTKVTVFFYAIIACFLRAFKNSKTASMTHKWVK